MYDVTYDNRRLLAVTPDTMTFPPISLSAPLPTWQTGLYPRNQLVPLTEVVHDRLNVENFSEAGRR